MSLSPRSKLPLVTIPSSPKATKEKEEEEGENVPEEDKISIKSTSATQGEDSPPLLSRTGTDSDIKAFTELVHNKEDTDKPVLPTTRKVITRSPTVNARQLLNRLSEVTAGKRDVQDVVVDTLPSLSEVKIARFREAVLQRFKPYDGDIFHHTYCSESLVIEAQRKGITYLKSGLNARIQTLLRMEQKMLKNMKKKEDMTLKRIQILEEKEAMRRKIDSKLQEVREEAASHVMNMKQRMKQMREETDRKQSQTRKPHPPSAMKPNKKIINKDKISLIRKIKRRKVREAQIHEERIQEIQHKQRRKLEDAKIYKNERMYCVLDESYRDEMEMRQLKQQEMEITSRLQTLQSLQEAHAQKLASIV